MSVSRCRFAGAVSVSDEAIRSVRDGEKTWAELDAAIRLEFDGACADIWDREFQSFIASLKERATAGMS